MIGLTDSRIHFQLRRSWLEITLPGTDSDHRGRMGCHELTTTKDSLEIDFENRHFKGEFVCEPWCHELRAWIEESTSKEVW